MKRLLRQGISFTLISGCGWLLDFTVYTILTEVFSCSVAIANAAGAIPGVTFVFLLATRKTFVRRPDGLPLPVKYLLYAAYQIALITAVSLLGQWLYQLLLTPVSTWGFLLLTQHLKLVIKICITPVTLVTNFFVLGSITEKL